MMTPDELTQALTRLGLPLDEDPAAWPEGANALLPLSEVEAETPADAALLELVADAFRRHEDIQRAYPHFYQRLQRNPALRDAFLEILEMMEDGENE